MHRPDTTDPAYAERLAASVAPRHGWRAVVDPQRPYRWNIRRLGLGRVLDIGCGVGRNLSHLDGNGVGVDHNADSVRIARARGLAAYTTDEFTGSVDDRPGSFDSLLFAHVLEHMTPPDATALVRSYLPYLRPGGRVAVICPQERGQASDATHVTFLDAAAITELLLGTDVTVERTTSFPLPRAAGRVFTHNETVVVGRWGARTPEGQPLWSAADKEPTMFRKKTRPSAETATPQAAPAPARATVLDQYVRTAPTNQNAIDVFAGEWTSALPAEADVQAGAVPLFADPRITWLIDHVGGVDGFRVLELGPLEGGHSAMLHQAGASVVAIESNTRAYLKCLVVKEILDLPRCHFLLGDFVPYLQACTDRFDLMLASGVLYHSPDPLAMLEAMGRTADRIAIWTHYFEPAVVAADPGKERMFVPEPERVSWRGHDLVLHRRNYLESLEWTGFCGGPESSALWMERDGLLTVLAELGYSKLTIESDDHANPNGACIMLCAER